MVDVRREYLSTDVLIIGGGTAGCLAAAYAKEEHPELDVLIVEKAHIDRSGCLAAGMNAINVYMNPGETPESFTKYVRYDACGLIREDLVQSGASLINEVVQKVESWGLPIMKDDNGQYKPRGRWNIKINGESLKPIIAAGAIKAGARVLNRVAMTGLLTSNGRVVGAIGFGVRDGVCYIINAKTVIMATGGAAGLYKPNNPGAAHHKMWYSPFNAGAGYAMGIRAGAEMTSLEMRFIALRTKDIISPTGTLALGFGASQVNAKGEKFMSKNFSHLGGEGAPTPLRVYGPTKEVKEGRGPCYMDTTHLTPEKVHELKASFLDMYPDIVLYWAANGMDVSQEPIEIAGTEPYIMGGHCQAGYWVDADRKTTLPGLYAAGDVAGGYPYKFVSGCWAEGVIAGRAACQEAMSMEMPELDADQVEAEVKRIYAPMERWQSVGDGVMPWEMEERLQKVMDEYAGGFTVFYEMNDERLNAGLSAVKRIKDRQTKYLLAKDWHELMKAHEVLDRVTLAEPVVMHLLYRKETRWPGYQTRLDYTTRDDFRWLCFVNSKLDTTTGQIIMSEKPYKQLIPGDRYMPR